LIKIKCGIVKFLGSCLWVKGGKCIVPKNLISYKFVCIQFIFRHGTQHESHYLLMILNLNFCQLCRAKTFSCSFNFVLMLPCEGNSSFMWPMFSHKGLHWVILLCDRVALMLWTLWEELFWIVWCLASFWYVIQCEVFFGYYNLLFLSMSLDPFQLQFQSLELLVCISATL
jgi:hypothetical protein